jgi:hypothetical protein
MIHVSAYLIHVRISVSDPTIVQQTREALHTFVEGFQKETPRRITMQDRLSQRHPRTQKAACHPASYIEAEKLRKTFR